MTQDAVTETKVRTELAARFAVPDTELGDDASLRDDLGADSLAIADVLASLEQDLDVELPDSDAFISGLRTVGDLVAAFRAAVAAA